MPIAVQELMVLCPVVARGIEARRSMQRSGMGASATTDERSGHLPCLLGAVPVRAADMRLERPASKRASRVSRNKVP